MGNTQKKLGIAKKGAAGAAPAAGGGKDGARGAIGAKAPKNAPGSRAADVAEQQHVEQLLKKGPISDYYDVDYNAILGRGHYATVYLGREKKSGFQVAVKHIQISKSRVEALRREVDVLRTVGKHPNIVTLYDIFITETELILVLEVLLGGELFDRMVEKGPYSEREASHHIRKIGQALKFLHRAGIVHRDLKPENLLLTHKGDNSDLKIADFGLANIVDSAENSVMKTVCGTWAYCAPEVKTSMTEEGGHASYTAKVDLWSVGVIMFVILAAYHPFDADGDATDAQLWSNICSGKFDFNDPAWDHISSSAKDLIRHLIVVDPNKRYGTDELLNHPWVQQTGSVPATPITPNINRSLIDFNDRRKSKKGFVAKVKRMNPLAGSPTTPTGQQYLGTQPITEQDLIEQHRILEEQRIAEAKQKLQVVHYQEQQQLKQQQEQAALLRQQQQQMEQQQLLVQITGQPIEEQQRQLGLLQQVFQQQVNELQNEFQQQQQQLLARQEQEIDALRITSKVSAARQQDGYATTHYTDRIDEGDEHQGGGSSPGRQQVPSPSPQQLHRQQQEQQQQHHVQQQQQQQQHHVQQQQHQQQQQQQLQPNSYSGEPHQAPPPGPPSDGLESRVHDSDGGQYASQLGDADSSDLHKQQHQRFQPQQNHEQAPGADFHHMDEDENAPVLPQLTLDSLLPGDRDSDHGMMEVDQH